MPISQIKAGAVLNYVLIGVNILVGLLYTPYMLRMLGQNEYGLYSLVATIIAYLTLLDLGMGTAVVRYTAKFRAEGRDNETASMYGMFFILYTIIGIVAFVIGMGLYYNLDLLFDKTMSDYEISQARIMIILLLVNLAITFPMGIFNSIITAYEEFIFQKILNILRVVLSTIVVILLLYAGFKAVAMVVAQTVFNITVLFINFIFCYRRLGIRLKFERVNMPFIKEVLLFSFWAFLSDIMYRVYWGSGQFVLGAIDGTVAVAIFSVGVTLMQMYMMFSGGISSVLLPKITEITTHDSSEKKISDLFIRVGRLQYSILIFLLSGFILFGQSFIKIWAGEGYELVYPISLIFFFPCLIPLIQNTGIAVLQARNQMKFRSVMLVCVAVASLIFQILLSYKYGVLGCSIAIGAANFIGQGIILNIYYSKIQKIDIAAFWNNIIKMSVIPVIMTIAGWFVLRNIEINNIRDLTVGVAVYSVAYIPLFWKFGMNDSERLLLLHPLHKIINIMS